MREVAGRVVEPRMLNYAADGVYVTRCTDPVRQGVPPAPTAAARRPCTRTAGARTSTTLPFSRPLSGTATQGRPIGWDSGARSSGRAPLATFCEISAQAQTHDFSSIAACLAHGPGLSLQPLTVSKVVHRVFGKFGSVDPTRFQNYHTLSRNVR